MSSDYMDALHRLMQDALRCPACGAANRPTVYYIELNQDRTRALCNVCTKSGPVEQFQDH